MNKVILNLRHNVTVPIEVLEGKEIRELVARAINTDFPALSGEDIRWTPIIHHSSASVPKGVSIEIETVAGVRRVRKLTCELLRKLKVDILAISGIPDDTEVILRYLPPGSTIQL